MADLVDGLVSSRLHGEGDQSEVGDTMVTAESTEAGSMAGSGNGEDGDSLSPTSLRSDEFTGLIAATEASMRGKLSQLTLPDSNFFIQNEADIPDSTMTDTTVANTSCQPKLLSNANSAAKSCMDDVLGSGNSDKVDAHEGQISRIGRGDVDNVCHTSDLEAKEQEGMNTVADQPNPDLTMLPDLPEESDVSRAQPLNLEEIEESDNESQDSVISQGIERHSKVTPESEAAETDETKQSMIISEIEKIPPTGKSTEDVGNTSFKDKIMSLNKTEFINSNSQKTNKTSMKTDVGAVNHEVPVAVPAIETVQTIIGEESIESSTMDVDEHGNETVEIVKKTIINSEKTESVEVAGVENVNHLNYSEKETDKGENEYPKDLEKMSETDDLQTVEATSTGGRTVGGLSPASPQTAPDMFGEEFMITDVRSLTGEDVMNDDNSLTPEADKSQIESPRENKVPTLNGQQLEQRDSCKAKESASVSDSKANRASEGISHVLPAVSTNQTPGNSHVTTTSQSESGSGMSDSSLPVISSTFSVSTNQAPSNSHVTTTSQSKFGSGMSDSGLPVISNAFSVSTNQAPGNSHVTTTSQSKSGSGMSVSSLPVISNTFSIKDEPVDNHSYGLASSDSNLNRNNVGTSNKANISTVVNMLHGRKVNPDPEKAAKSQKLRVTKVSTNISAFNSSVLTKPSGTSHLDNIKNVASANLPHCVTRIVDVASRAQNTKQGIPGSYTVVSNNPKLSLQMSKTSKTQPACGSLLQNMRTTVQPAGTIVTVNQATGQAVVLPRNITVVTPNQSGNSQLLSKAMVKVNMDTININTVGIPKLTELIARKNPIPTYKPPPVPEKIRTPENSKTYPCYECGDSFYLKTSLDQHTNRCSMKMSYKCEHCKYKVIVFTNKCQLLGHLRSHMNIENTQAVPIHIKSDSIEIVTNFDDIKLGTNFDWYTPAKEAPIKEKPISVMNGNGSIQADKILTVEKNGAIKNIPFVKKTLIRNSSVCTECGTYVHSEAKMKSHFQDSENGSIFFCDICPVYMPNACGLAAHRRIHEIKTVTDCPSKLTCPECGLEFSKETIYQFLTHLKIICFHTSRLVSFNCLKCKSQFRSVEGLQNHLHAMLEHYYKCEKCPMALKSLKNFEQHFSTKHQSVPKSDKIHAKIIYRCHVCDTLIDDRSFLVSHVKNHVSELKKVAEFSFHCLQCGQNFSERNALTMHYHKEHYIRYIRRRAYCTFCQKDLVDQIIFIQHTLMEHSKIGCKLTVKLCDYCGLYCRSESIFQKHACLVEKTRVLGDSDISSINEKNDKNIEKNDKNKERAGETAVGHTEKTNQISLPDFSSLEPDNVGDITDNSIKSCRSCNISFRTEGARNNHLKLHRMEQIYICIHCDRMNFRSFHDLRSHEIMCSEVKKKRELDAKENTESKNKSEAKFFNGGDDSIETTPLVEDNEDDDFGRVRLTPKVMKKNKKPEVQVTYLCDQCDEVFTRQSKLEEHKKLEHGWHPCHLCGEIYESNSMLKRHLMLSHEGKKFVFYCWICRGRKIEKYFSEKTLLERHLGRQHRMKNWDESKIVAELPGLEGKGSSPEPQKRKASENNSSPNEAPVKKLKVEGEIAFKCAKCFFTSEVKDEFLQHIVEHKTDDTSQCFECGLCFAVLPSLKKHLFMVHKVRDFTAYLKDNNIEEVSEVNNVDDDGIEREPIRSEPIEESSSEEDEGNPLECKVCSREFDNQIGLKKHMRNHGMAFIKKSRRRAVTSSPKEKEKAYEAENVGEKKEKLVLKIKRPRLDVADHEVVVEGNKLDKLNNTKIEQDSVESKSETEIQPGHEKEAVDKSKSNEDELLKKDEDSIN